MALVAFAVLAAPALADVTLTGNIKTVGTANVGAKLLVRFELQNCVASGQNIPRVIGVGILNQTYFDYPVDASGNIVAADGGTAKIYGNDQITCDTLGNSWYRVYIIYERDKQFYGDFDVTGTSFNLNSATPRTAGAGVYSGVAALTNPAGSQTITQPANSTLILVQSTTGASAFEALYITPTWNTSASPTAFRLNVTNTASGSGALLEDLQVGAVSKWKVDKSGNATAAGAITAGGDLSGTAFLLTGTGSHGNSVRFIDGGATSTSIAHNVPTGGVHNFAVNGVTSLQVTSSNISISTGRIYFSGGGAPSCTFTSGGGTTPSCTLDTGSRDSAGVIIATTGTGSPGSSGDITLTFSASLGSNRPACVFTLNNVDTGQWNARATVRDKNTVAASSAITWDNNAVALSASTPYRLNYFCGGK